MDLKPYLLPALDTSHSCPQQVHRYDRCQPCQHELDHDSEHQCLLAGYSKPQGHTGGGTMCSGTTGSHSPLFMKSSAPRWSSIWARLDIMKHDWFHHELTGVTVADIDTHSENLQGDQSENKAANACPPKNTRRNHYRFWPQPTS